MDTNERRLFLEINYLSAITILPIKKGFPAKEAINLKISRYNCNLKYNQLSLHYLYAAFND